METIALIKNKIINAFNLNHLPSSIIFFGPGSQTEKDDFIYDLSFSILKINRDIAFDKFLLLASGNNIPDLLVFSKGSSGSIKVEDIERIDSVINYRPFESQNRIFYFRDAQTMTPQAQNAILKKIEEPNSNNYFFLSTNKKNSLLSTITSRCVSFYIPENISDISDNAAIPPERFYPFINELIDILGTEYVNAQKKIIEIEALNFDSGRLTSLSSFERYISDFSDLDIQSPVDKEYLKRLVIKMRLAFLSYFLKNKYPDVSERIALFLNNRQFFSVDSTVFFNLIGDEIGK